MEELPKIEGISPQYLWIALAVLLGLCAIIVLVGKTVQTVKGWGVNRERAKGLDQRVKSLRRDVEDMREGTQHMCAGVKALLVHALHDGNTDEIEKALSDLDKWLIRRK